MTTKTPETPEKKIPILKTLLLYARELEIAGFETQDLHVTERDGTRWRVTDNPRSQPIVTYLGAETPNPALADTAEHAAGKIPA